METRNPTTTIPMPTNHETTHVAYSGIGGLGQDVTEKIVGYLSFAGRVSLASTSRSFYALLSPMLSKKVCVPQGDLVHLTSKSDAADAGTLIGRTGQAIETMVIPADADSTYLLALTHIALPKLNRLDFHLVPDKVRSMLEHCADQQRSLAMIKTLSLINCREKLDPSFIQRLAQCFPQVESLFLANTRTDFSVTARLCGALPSAKKLHFEKSSLCLDGIRVM